VSSVNEDNETRKDVFFYLFIECYVWHYRYLKFRANYLSEEVSGSLLSVQMLQVGCDPPTGLTKTCRHFSFNPMLCRVSVSIEGLAVAIPVLRILGRHEIDSV